jgi:hypothetical protein
MLKILRLAFISNYRTKLTALVLAFVIWLFASLEVTETYRRDDISLKIAVTRKGLPVQDVMVEPACLYQIKGVFRCPRKLGDHYFAKGTPIEGTYKLEDPPIGVPIPVEITLKTLGLPSEITTASFDPKEIIVVVRQLMAKRLRVEPKLVGSPAEGYELFGKPTVEPTEVTVVGPADKLTTLLSISTEPILLDGRSVSFSGDYKIISNIDGTPIQCDTTVRVGILLREKEIQKEIELPLTIIIPSNYPYQVKLQPPGKIRLLVKGAQTVLQSPDIEKKIKAYIEIDETMVPLDPGVPYKRKVKLLTPAEMPDLSLGETKEVDVEIVSPKKEGEQ